MEVAQLRRLPPVPNALSPQAMAGSTSGGGGALSAQAAAALGEGIGLVFARWTALQMAVENQWGGRDSRAKADQLAESILSWFANSKGKHYYEDLVDMMYDTVSESFNADFEDGSVEEVAEQLLIMHEECLQSNYSSVEKLRNSRAQGNAVSQSRKMVVDGDDDSSDDDEDDEPSMVDNEAGSAEKMAVDEPKPSKPVPDADGWTVVPPRRGRGKN
uniref:Pre-rRNA-processing protein TSR2 homolog n=1 Tax=Oryza punctata TaxID=4537 RepID=A0A0E0LWQ2_ORYPU